MTAKLNYYLAVKVIGKVRDVILCFVLGGYSQWYEHVNLKFGLFLSVTSYRSFYYYMYKTTIIAPQSLIETFPVVPLKHE